MNCIFLNAAGVTLFVRDDMESGHWVQEQMNVTADFLFDPGKVIQTGQRIAFRDPATDVLQVFEIINVTNSEPDHYQQITAEHICISELSDEHIKEIFDDEEMLATAEEFLHSSLNVSETSRNLYMHRNTLLYRLDKIEKATGLNIRSFSDAVSFRVLTLIHRLLGK